LSCFPALASVALIRFVSGASTPQLDPISLIFEGYDLMRKLPESILLSLCLAPHTRLRGRAMIVILCLT
jgi:hypothetical protein